MTTLLIWWTGLWKIKHKEKVQYSSPPQLNSPILLWYAQNKFFLYIIRLFYFFFKKAIWRELSGRNLNLNLKNGLKEWWAYLAKSLFSKLRKPRRSSNF